MLKVKSLNKQLERSFKKNWWRPALSNYKGETMNYAMLAERIAIIQRHYRRFGVNPGDKIAICGRNQANWGVSFLSVMTYGAVPVPLLHDFNPANITELVLHSEAKVLFIDELIWEKLDSTKFEGLLAAVSISDFRILYTTIDNLEKERAKVISDFHTEYASGLRPENLDFYRDSPDELALINYTSGTSGFSKGVMIPYRALASNIAFAHLAEPHIKPGCEVVAMLPSAHMYGMMFEFLFEMSLGAHVHFLTRVPSPKIIMQAFAEIHPCIIIAVPLIIEKVYKSKLKPILEKNRLFFRLPILDKVLEKKVCTELVSSFGGNFEEIILGGAAFNPEVEGFLHKIGFPFTVGYGMTECAPIITYAHWNKAKLGSCGMAAPNMEIRIDSDDPHNIAGEVQVRGANVFLGYFKNDEATANSFTEDGWFRTGDMGVMDEDGYLFLRGRSKCMILGPSGQNIYPEELEAVINSLTYVVDSLVIEEDGGLTALIYPDYHQGELDGLSRSDLEKRLNDALPEINKEIPNYAKIKKIEFMPEDFERTPKRSIKRYLYQRN